MPDTQGNRKFKQYLEDLRKNKDFQKRATEVRQEKSKGKRNSLLIKLCDDFGIDWELFQNIKEDDEDNSSDWANSVDMCEVGFDFDETFADIAFKSDLEKKLHKNAYPISIDVHKFARKRDVLDFIEKNWSEIENHLNFFRGKKKIFRSRKNEERNDFIWKNKELGANAIKKILNDKFPGNNLVYWEINDILRSERNRRSQKLA
jgi:hypothetical protein